MRIIRTFILILILFSLSACTSQQNVRQKAIDDLLAKNDSLFIGGQKLSPDGQYLVFDFVENFTRGKGDLRRKHVFAALYDLNRGQIEILSPLGNNVGTHSPSFDHSGQYLTMVTSCHERTCPKKIYGSQIIVLHLRTGEVEQITTARMKHILWGWSWGPNKSRKSSVGISGRVTLKGYPVFSPDKNSIYYVSNGTPSGSSVFHRQFDVDFELRILNRNHRNGKFIWIDEQVFKEDHDVVIFGGSGQLSMQSNGTLLMSANKPLGLKWRYYRERDVSAFYYDTAENELSVAFDKHNTPVTRNQKKANKSGTFSSSHSASIDGQKISLVREFGKTVSIVEGGKFRDIITTKDIGNSNISTAALSGDGNWLAVFFSQSRSVDHRGVFWLVNLKTGVRKSLPLHTPLRRALDNKFKKDRCKSCVAYKAGFLGMGSGP